MANILYKGQTLNLRAKIDTSDHSFHNTDSLWITSPEQRNMPGMKFVGGFPNEYCIDLKEIAENGEYRMITHAKDNSPIGFIIKEKGRYQAYLTDETSFPCEGQTLDEANMWFWQFVWYEDRYGVIVGVK